MNEAVNDSTKLIAQAIRELSEYNTGEFDHIIKLLEQVLDKLLTSK